MKKMILVALSVGFAAVANAGTNWTGTGSAGYHSAPTWVEVWNDKFYACWDLSLSENSGLVQLGASPSVAAPSGSSQGAVPARSAGAKLVSNDDVFNKSVRRNQWCAYANFGGDGSMAMLSLLKDARISNRKVMVEFDDQMYNGYFGNLMIGLQMR